MRGVTISGCYFHFIYNLWRHIQELGLQRLYRRKRRVCKFIRKLMAIGYLLLPLVQDIFDMIVTQPKHLRLMRRYSALIEFVRYMHATNINPNGSIPPRLWNVHDDERYQDQQPHWKCMLRLYKTGVTCFQSIGEVGQFYVWFMKFLI